MSLLASRVAAARKSIRTGSMAELAMAIAFVLGLVLAPLHWAGLVAGGALLGLTAPTVRRAVVLGLVYGLLVLLLFGIWLAFMGTLGKTLAMSQLVLVTVIIGLALPSLASGAVRGLT